MSLYTIEKGEHYFLPVPSIHSGKVELFGTIRFDSSCKYDLSGVPNCKNDTNKAIGIGYGLWPNSHHTWSIRLGWRVNNGKLILVHYSYINKKVTNIVIGRNFKFDTDYTFSIINDRVNKTATVRVGDLSVTVPFDKAPEYGYILKPYFGGDCSAPHHMEIDLTYT